MYFLFFYLFAILVLGSFYVGPFSIRVYTTVLMMLFLIIKRLSSWRRIGTFRLSNKIIVYYLLFILFAAIALLFNGEYNQFDFNKWILANYLNCIVTYYAIDYFISDKEKMKSIWLFFVLFGVANGIITILQFIGNPIGKGVALALTNVSAVQADMIDEFGVDTDLLLGAGVPFGLFGFLFTNGMMVAALGILMMGREYGKKKMTDILWVILIILSIYACYATQERAAFFLLIMLILFFISKGSIPHNYKIVISVVVLLLIAFFIPHFFESGRLGRLATINLAEDTRGDLWSVAFNFMKNNLILGGPIAYSKVSIGAPHNFFLFVFVYYGLIAGVIVSYLYIIMTTESIRILFGRYSVLTRSFAAACCIYSAICLFHNASVATGDAIIFVFYALVEKSKLIDINYRRKSYRHYYENHMLH